MTLYTERQLPPVSASAFLIDLEAHGGPRYTVLARDHTDARAALVSHLREIGFGVGQVTTTEMVNEAEIERIEVIW